MNIFRKLLGDLPKFDWKITVMTIVSTLLIMVDYYFPLTESPYFDHVIIYLLIPLIFIVLVFRERPADYGFQIGDWKAGVLITGIAILVIAPVLWWVVRSDSAMQEYYRNVFTPLLPVNIMMDLIGWEFLFRGWLLFGYEKKFGSAALWLQAVPFALAHLTKPGVETLSTIFGGFVFGWVAWRTRSFLYPFLIHYFVSTFTILLAAGKI
jgi:membrane protease YdiL (CAAX protease family)